MASFNEIILLGRLGRDPELRYTPDNTPIVNFSLATTKKWKGKDGQEREKTCRIDCEAGARAAEVLNEFCKKGDLLFLTGELEEDVWDDKQTGKQRRKHKVRIATFQLMPRRGDTANSAAQAGQRPSGYAGMARKGGDAPKTDAPYQERDGGGPVFEDRDIPFGPNKC